MSDVLKILRVIDSMHPSQGGPCQGIRNSIPALSKLGTHNEVVSLDDPDAAFIENDSFTIHAVGPSKGPWGYGVGLIPWLKENLCRFDVVIIHGLWQYYSHATVKAVLDYRNSQSAQKEKKSPRLFVMPHGMLDPYFQKAPDRKLKAIRNWFYWKLIEQKVVNKADGVLFTCQDELLLARQTFRPYRPQAELNVGYGIGSPPLKKSNMTDAFLEKCTGLLSSEPYFLFLSRVHPKKGVDLLIQAYAKIREHNIPKLVIVGPGMDSDYGQKLRKQVSENEHISKTVFFPGMLSGDAKWGAFYNCEAFVLPSHQENFGIAIVEALACSKAVLISNKVNIWNEIEGAVAGLVEGDTLDGTYGLLEQWLAMNSEHQMTMSTNAQNLFETNFKVDTVSKRFFDAIS